MPENRKRAVSLRVSINDLRKVKKLAQRLDVRDSDVIRFALKTTLARLAPLCDNSVRGRALVPVFIEAGGELFHHFDIDGTRLEEIVNGGTPKEQAVESEDLHRIAIAGMQQTYTNLQAIKPPADPSAIPEAPPPHEALQRHLRGYLYAKYVDTEFSSDPTIAK